MRKSKNHSGKDGQFAALATVLGLVHGYGVMRPGIDPAAASSDHLDDGELATAIMVIHSEPYAVVLTERASGASTVTGNSERTHHDVLDVANLSSAIQVRLESVVVAALDEILASARGQSTNRVSRSSLVRWAVESYVSALASLIDAGRPLDDKTVVQLEGTEVGESGPLNGLVRVRLRGETIEALNVIEAYAGGLGRRKVTRSSMIRAAVTAFVVGFAEEMLSDLGDNGTDMAPRRSGSGQS